MMKNVFKEKYCFAGICISPYNTRNTAFGEAVKTQDAGQVNLVQN